MKTPRPVLRRCVACRQLLDRRQLWRVIRDHQDGVLLDVGMGRSAYLCPKETCLEEARRRKRLQKALRCQVPDSVVEVLQERLSLHQGTAAEAR
ncbi:YlxR family protein [Synechococcus sp. WH 8101]|uniref:YlxR family protein n=1 Tax=Synechococcus sp. WH 8101 TaxID=59932 RepID=UPI0010236215|nr:YlxR family protein [Synechococcus sp. WH 8101]